MIVKIVKIHYLGFLRCCCGQCGVSSFLDSSLVRLIFLKIYTSKAVPSVLASSVCWSLQCLFSALTQGGWWWTLFFLGSLVQSRCREGGMLQTNNTGECSQCLSHTGPAPAHSAHSSGSRSLRWEPSEAGPGLHAPPRSKPLGLRHSGSPQRCRLGWACVLCPSQVQVAQVFGERGHCNL